MADGLDAHVGAVAVGQRADHLDWVGRTGVDDVRRAELSRELELAGDEVDADDSRSSCESCARDRRAPDTAATEHCHRVALAHVAGEDRCAQSRHHAATEQPRRRRRRRGIHFRALSRRHQGLFSERTDAECGRQLGAVLQRHRLRGVVRGEAIPGASTPARAAFTAHRPPVQNHEVAGLDTDDAVTDRLHHAGGFMAE